MSALNNFDKALKIDSTNSMVLQGKVSSFLSKGNLLLGKNDLKML